MRVPRSKDDIMKQGKKVRNRIMRGAFAGSAALIPLAGVTAVAVNPAAATPTGIKCSKVSGTVNATANTSVTNLTSCTGHTGGSGKINAAASPTSAKITWKAAGHESITIGGITINYVVGGPGCPVVGPHGPLVTDESESGTVTADNTGSTSVGAAMSADLCVYATPTSGEYTVSNAPGTDFVIAP
jgi:hypothetical protein